MFVGEKKPFLFKYLNISIVFKQFYDKDYKIFIVDENLFVCIIIYFSKNKHFKRITKNVRIINKYSLKYKLY